MGSSVVTLALGFAVLAVVGLDARPATAPEGSAARAAVEVPAPGTYAWPVEGAVLRPFELPSSTYGPGHRGIDIGTPAGTRVLAAERGLVAFAGVVAGERYVSVDHPDGVRTTYSWLASIAVRRGDRIERGAILGTTSRGHPGSETPHLHLGARFRGVYVDPLLLLEPRGVAGLIHLAPLDPGSPLGPPRP
ncbi:MAG TPA: M23 family metallopeptidase [Actinomycetota bacterium]|nr:M23 family metallopeptidase [Actinomycetota bacterium]